MRNRGQQRAAETADTLERVAAELADRLVGSGWERRVGDPHKLASFVHPVGRGDYFACVDISHGAGGPVRRYDDWPEALYLHYGCGFQPAFALMSRVGLDPDLGLVDEPDTGMPGRSFPDAQINDAADVNRAVEQVLADIEGHGTEFATSLSNVESMAHALRDPELTPDNDVRIELLPLFLAAVGRTVEAVDIADRYLDAHIAFDQAEYADFVARLRKIPQDGPPTAAGA